MFRVRSVAPTGMNLMIFGLINCPTVQFDTARKSSSTDTCLEDRPIGPPTQTRRIGRPTTWIELLGASDRPGTTQRRRVRRHISVRIAIISASPPKKMPGVLLCLRRFLT